LSDLLRAVAQINRLAILSSLLEGEKEFSKFKEELDLSKTAIANHLSVLLENNLVEKIERGSYAISQDGKNILHSIAANYRRSQVHSLKIRKRLWEKYLPDENEAEKVSYDSYTIKKPAYYRGGWLSYVSSITGILHSLNQKIDAIDVAGYTGYAFFFNVAQGLTDPSGPTGIRDMDSFHKGIHAFGWRVKEFLIPLSRKNEDLPIKPSYFSKLFEKVKKELKRTNRPVVLWGIPIPEYGIVNGYDSDSYIVSTLRSTDPEKRFGPDTNIEYDDIISPGRLQALFFEKRIEIPDLYEVDLHAIKKAIQMEKHHQNGSGYISGPHAFQEWADVLQGELKFVSYHGNSYVSECMCEALNFATQFTTRLAQRYIKSSQNQYLTNASDQFRIANTFICRYRDLFPFGFDGDLNLKKRINAADILKRITPHISRAFNSLELAIENWE
jgi:DNA-binding transcriptional ArsR family regulator